MSQLLQRPLVLSSMLFPTYVSSIVPPPILRNQHSHTVKHQRYDDKQPLATTIFPHEPTLEFTTRMAKLLARKLHLPVYVTNSISFVNAGMGGTVEEEMEAFKHIVHVVVPKIRDAGLGPATTNGVSS